MCLCILKAQNKGITFKSLSYFHKLTPASKHNSHVWGKIGPNTIRLCDLLTLASLSDNNEILD